jgi:protein-L-isoaspartate(D-aspartate) O-methyltransferase
VRAAAIGSIARLAADEGRWSAASMARAIATPEMERARMIEHDLRRRGIYDTLVLRAFAQVPREEFVPPELREHAYADCPLPIGNGQTISQPFVVAMTVQALELQGHERVLEIGTGSGYAAAILGAMVREVETIERIEELARTAADRLARLGFANVRVRHGDGTLGWPAGAPYEAICVAAGAPRPPPSLLAQLAIGGRLVLPHGDPDQQRLVRIVRTLDSFVEQDLGDVRFVPLVGAEGWPEPRPARA